jgi:hypothetical protein
MKTLTQADFNKARTYLKTQARPLERRLFAFYFEHEPMENTLADVAQFQNKEDGGFGNALEPDFRMPESSPMATSFALHLFKEIGAPSEQRVVANAVHYILGCYNPQSGTWPMVSAEVNNHPHAPWWHYDLALRKVPAESTGNPTAQIVSSLLSWPELVPAGLLESLTNLCLERISKLTAKAGMEELSGYLEFVKAVPAEKRGRPEDKLKELVSKIVARHPSAWASYGPQPLVFVDSPESFLYDGLRQAVEDNLDYLVDRQDPAGGWVPNWDWGGDFPEVWDVAHHEWRGVLTLVNLRKLRAFGRLE